ncbi:MAG: hypothetical protein CM15mP83_4540 [Flavobacteriaceae bacterium]|nr:MAG: hypothetical protein CM15mP83_4540 [Flavobacteriaceae bacterium]
MIPLWEIIDVELVRPTTGKIKKKTQKKKAQLTLQKQLDKMIQVPIMLESICRLSPHHSRYDPCHSGSFPNFHNSPSAMV